MSAIKKEVIIGDCRLILGDCLEVMPLLGEFDLCLTDPPYGTTACAWDAVIPLEEMWILIKSRLKNLGTACIFSQQPFTAPLISSNIENFKYDLIWHKTKCANFQQSKNMPQRKHEVICVFSDGVIGHEVQTQKRMTYNPQGVQSCNKFNIRKKCNDPHAIQRENGVIKGFKQTQTGYPDTVLFYSNPHNPPHPTQKPLPLLEYLVRCYSHPSEKVLDFTMGSGTTGVACVKLGRKFTGIELDPEYFEISCERIRKAYEQPDMFVEPPSKPLEPVQDDLLEQSAEAHCNG